MLRNLKSVMRHVLVTTDGKLDGCRDFLFDDRDWVVRYVVADTRRWRPGRKVLLSPMVLGRPDWESRHIPVMLSKAEIETSPDLAEDAPVSKAYETRWHEHYGFAPYWGASRIGSSAARHIVENEVDAEHEEHLCSVAEVGDYHVLARDGRAGRVVDFIVDDETWAIRWLAVGTRRWPSRRDVLIEPRSVTAIRWADRDVFVDLTKRALAECPEYDPDAPVNRATATLLWDYGGRPHAAPEVEELRR